MPNRFSQRILAHVADKRYRPQETRALAAELRVAREDLEEFRRSVQELVREGHVLLSGGDTVALPPPGREMLGSFRANPKGFGFVVPESPREHGDLFIPPGQTMGAMSGDRVRVAVSRQPGRESGDRSPYVGKVVEIVQRAEKQYVGDLRRQGNGWVVQIDGKMLLAPVVIRDVTAKNAKEGDKVVIDLVRYPSEEAPAEGVIVDVLGEKGEPEVETRAVMRAYGLAEEFPPEALEDARRAARSFDDRALPADRLDLTRDFIVTIDPPDAKDFDDAISLARFEKGSIPGMAPEAVWELGVHIADVSHFVKSGGALDNESKKRGNSTYLPRRVVPMLPELLSNGVCSLQENVNRFTKSAFMQYDAQGNVVGQRFASSVIRSAKRLTYLEAQALIDGDIKQAIKHAATEPKYPPRLAGQLKLMDELARVIRARRLAAGMIVLGLPEVELVYDESGRVVDAHPTDTSFTHTLIEQFMVEANEALARLFDGLGVPMIRRVHADPPAHDVSELRRFARVAGFNIPAHPSRRELQQLLDAVRGKPAQQAVHLAVLQTLSRAEYSPTLIGHFALASEHYTHFTSPIRRYPDLIVHRGLEAYLDHAASLGPAGKNKKRIAQAMLDDPRVPGELELYELGRHCSTTERNSQSAEQELRTYLVLELISTMLGQDFSGTVTGITSGGAFVQIDRYLVDGFIRTADLPSAGHDTWRFNRVSGALVAQRSGRSIVIGDRFTVRIAKVNPAGRQLDLVIIESPGTPGSPGTRGPGKQSQGKPQGQPQPRPQQQQQHGHGKRVQPKGAKASHQQNMKFKQRKNRGKRR